LATGEEIAMRHGCRCALGALTGAVAALTILVAALEVSVAAMTTRSISAGSIDRTLKSDRLPSVSGSLWPARQQPDPKLPDGCLAASEWHTNIFSAEVAGRCVA
jgi:hypothetical protein